MDIQGLTFVGLVVIGTVNVIDIFKPDIDSRIKVGIAFVVAFVASFVPVSFGNVILTHAKTAIEIALASSGVYKLFTKAGGDLQ